MTNKVYWAERREYTYNRIILDVEKELANEYIRCANSTKSKLSALLDELEATSKEDILISDLYKYNRYYDLINSLNANLIKLGNKEITLLGQAFKKMYETNSQLIADELGFNFPVDEEAVKKAINGVWCEDGRHWSDRVWISKDGLRERVQKGIVDCIARGASRKELTEDLMKNFDRIGYYEADRLARTELSYIQNQSTYDRYAQAGIKQYEFYATDDAVVSKKNKGKTCTHCQELDGKIYALKDAQVGVNYPPLHPHCRCTVLAVKK